MNQSHQADSVTGLRTSSICWEGLTVQWRLHVAIGTWTIILHSRNSSDAT